MHLGHADIQVNRAACLDHFACGGVGANDIAHRNAAVYIFKHLHIHALCTQCFLRLGLGQVAIIREGNVLCAKADGQGYLLVFFYSTPTNR